MARMEHYSSEPKKPLKTPNYFLANPCIVPYTDTKRTVAGGTNEMTLHKLTGPTDTPASEMLERYIDTLTYIEYQWYGTKLQYVGDFVIKPSGFSYLGPTKFETKFTVTDANDDVFTFFAILEK